MQALLELLQVGFCLGGARRIGLADDVHRDDRGEEADDEDDHQDLDQRETGFANVRSAHR